MMPRYDFNSLGGIEMNTDSLHRQLYATDASVYRILPEGVCFPKNKLDIVSLVNFARENKIPLIPRAGGTSLAGQVVGSGLIVDVSKYFNNILDFDAKAKTVTVEPGVVRHDLNAFLAPHQLFFGPNTSTSNRCTIGGMVGNNSSGTTSIKYGVTRDKIQSVECVLYDGSLVVFKAKEKEECSKKGFKSDLEHQIYQFFTEILSDPDHQKSIRTEYPKATVHRRNTGYALDALLNDFTDHKVPMLNLAKLIAGSEGTLGFVTAITLSLDDVPPQESVMVAAHYDSIKKCLRSVAPLMKHPLYTCEMMDKTILDCTKNNSNHAKNRFFLKGDPQGILMLELRAHTASELNKQLNSLEGTLERMNLSYGHSVLRGKEIDAALNLRSAGLGLLGNIVGDEKAVACIEDTAVPVDQLADYIEDFTVLMGKFHQSPVYYAHAGAGELHLRPMLNLKKNAGVKQFKSITKAVAQLVKKYHGSMSGEHGDGIVRSEYIALMLGKKNHSLLQEVKRLFDPHNLFNPGKIIGPLPMDQNLRYQPERKEPEVNTFMDFSADQGILRAAEKCNGSGDCRKTTTDATICPSYRATKAEKDSTRGRANVLREVLTQGNTSNPFDSQELKAVMDLCIGCKACASECPSNVDVATYKAEFQYQFNKNNAILMRDRIFAFNFGISKFIHPFRGVQNTLFKTPVLGYIIKSALGIASRRSMPKLHAPLDRSLIAKKTAGSSQKVYLYLDEFTNYFDVSVGRDAYELLVRLGYQVEVLPASDSGRAYISKGFLKEAKACADQNITRYKDIVSDKTPLLGIEPSALFTFKDEYPKLASDKKNARKLAKNCFLIEEFIAREISRDHISPNAFTDQSKNLKIHAHCYQKALGNPADTFAMLNLPKNYSVSLLSTGCCGMAGSFGYEKEHYEISQKIGEERLFPSVRKMDSQTVLAANGTSCRHQIFDGTQKTALHPVSILKNALVVK
ncbi:MAG: Anaerobic glycerol-3-phosphate dehydrogenase subunit C [Flavobacteriaceae bacterium]|nr:MAG: Anaerobic glycerol-3-phosphate dehydrogenase subunit C [Flavobacteriaceae bacterium]